MSEVNSFMQIAGGTPPPQPGAPAQLDETSETHLFSQIAAGQEQNQTKLPTIGPAPKKGILSRAADTMSQTEVPGTDVTLGEAGKRSGEFAKMAGEEALALFSGPEGGVASALTEGGRAAEGIARSAKFAHIFDEGETAAALEKTGKIKGILKSAYDWTKANPIKAYLLYKIADQAGIGPSGLKKVLHLVSGSEE